MIPPFQYFDAFVDDRAAVEMLKAADRQGQRMRARQTPADTSAQVFTRKRPAPGELPCEPTPQTTSAVAARLAPVASGRAPGAETPSPPWSRATSRLPSPTLTTCGNDTADRLADRQPLCPAGHTATTVQLPRGRGAYLVRLVEFVFDFPDASDQELLTALHGTSVDRNALILCGRQARYMAADPFMAKFQQMNRLRFAQMVKHFEDKMDNGDDLPGGPEGWAQLPHNLRSAYSLDMFDRERIPAIRVAALLANPDSARAILGVLPDDPLFDAIFYRVEGDITISRDRLLAEFGAHGSQHRVLQYARYAGSIFNAQLELTVPPDAGLDGFAEVWRVFKLYPHATDTHLLAAMAGSVPQTTRRTKNDRRQLALCRSAFSLWTQRGFRNVIFAPDTSLAAETSAKRLKPA